MTEPAIVVRDLRFRYRSKQGVYSPWVLDGVELTVPAASRTLVIGANGAGKSTLLRIVAGKHMVDRETVRVLGASAFHDTWLAGDVELLGGNWPFDVDLEVREMLAHKPCDPARRDHLIELLGVDLGWHMHAISDGQRRRVQLLMGLLRPRRVLLLDEVTTDLDLLARQDLLAFLRDESEARATTILYATHILDSLEDWATHLCYIVAGKICAYTPIAEVGELREASLLRVVERWLRRDSRPAG